MKHNNLDEMQEQELLKIEHNGCWLAFWGLLLAIIVQAISGKGDPFGEWILFMVLAVYLGIACMRKGIWDRRLKMDGKTNLLVSLVAAVCAGAFMFAFSYLRFDSLDGAIASCAIMAVSVFVLCLIALSLAARATKKRQEALNAEPDEK